MTSLTIVVAQAEEDVSKSQTESKLRVGIEENSPSKSSKYSPIYNRISIQSNNFIPSSPPRKFLTMSDILSKPIVNNTSSNSSNHKQYTPLRTRLLREVRDLYNSVLYSTDSGSRQNAAKIKQSKAIEYKTTGIRSLSQGGSRSTRRKISQEPIDDFKVTTEMIKSNADGLQKQIKVYNRFFEDYLVNPSVKFSSLHDLKVELLIRPKTSQKHIEESTASDVRSAQLKNIRKKLSIQQADSASSRRKVQNRQRQRNVHLDLDQKFDLTKVETEKMALHNEKQRVSSGDSRVQRTIFGILTKLFRDENWDDFESLLIKHPSLTLKRDGVIEFCSIQLSFHNIIIY